MAYQLSCEEQAVLDHLIAAWNAFVALPIEHPDQTTEFRHPFHDLQRQIMIRPLRRAMKDGKSEADVICDLLEQCIAKGEG